MCVCGFFYPHTICPLSPERGQPPDHTAEKGQEISERGNMTIKGNLANAGNTIMIMISDLPQTRLGSYILINPETNKSHTLTEQRSLSRTGCICSNPHELRVSDKNSLSLKTRAFLCVTSARLLFLNNVYKNLMDTFTAANAELAQATTQADQPLLTDKTGQKCSVSERRNVFRTSDIDARRQRQRKR